MIIVTAGRKYIDIDAYASMIAYRELLRATTNEEVYAFSTVRVNETVPPMLRNLKYQLDEPVDTKSASFILVDVSNPEFFDTFVEENRVIEVIDHHPGYDSYWGKRKKVRSQVEVIGAICSQIYERFVEAGRTDLLDTDLCKLLVAGILDNTINLKSKITSERDRKAYQELLKLGDLSSNWYQEYFAACETERTKDLKTAILNDMKAEYVSPLVPEAIGQIILFDKDILTYDILREVFADFDHWMINVIAIEDGRSYLYCDSIDTKGKLETLFNTSSNSDNLVILDDFILRKEILKRALDYKS